MLEYRAYKQMPVVVRRMFVETKADRSFFRACTLIYVSRHRLILGRQKWRLILVFYGSRDGMVAMMRGFIARGRPEADMVATITSLSMDDDASSNEGPGKRPEVSEFHLR
jgi:hypothetical protein